MLVVSVNHINSCLKYAMGQVSDELEIGAGGVLALATDEQRDISLGRTEGLIMALRLLVELASTLGEQRFKIPAEAQTK